MPLLGHAFCESTEGSDARSVTTTAEPSVRSRHRLAGIALMLTGAMANQTGTAIGALAFPEIGPAGVVAIRQWVGGALLLLVGRPKLRSFTRRQWWPVLLLAAVFARRDQQEDQRALS